MKFSTLFLYGQKIEVFNSWLGKESIKVNGEEKSSKYSLFGTTHSFQFEDEEGVSHDCQISFGMNLTGVVMDVYLDKQPVIVSPVISSWLNLYFSVVTVGVIMFLMGVFENTC